MRNRIRSVLILLLLLSISVAAQVPVTNPNAQALAPAKIRRIEEAVEAARARSGIPGMSAAVVVDNRLQWMSGFGMADLENSVPARPATVYRLASISKTITATAVMQLAERGKLDLDAPVQNYCPAFPQKQWKITARLLLGHLAGVRHYRGDETEITRHYSSVAEGLDVFKNDPLLAEPGTEYIYSSYGFNLLGCAVEGASGQRFTDYIRENIFVPAHMEHIQADDIYAIIQNRAQGYERDRNGKLKNSGLVDTSYKIPAGGLCSTVEDLARFTIALREGVLVKLQTLAQMWTKQKTSAGREIPYGLGWEIGEHKGMKTVYHGGAQQRVSTLLYTIPQKQFTVVLMSNLEDVRLAPLAAEIADIVLE